MVYFIILDALEEWGLLAQGSTRNMEENLDLDQIGMELKIVPFTWIQQDPSALPGNKTDLLHGYGIIIYRCCYAQTLWIGQNRGGHSTFYVD